MFYFSQEAHQDKSEVQSKAGHPSGGGLIEHKLTLDRDIRVGKQGIRG
jgi:hypothetical protein